MDKERAKQLLPLLQAFAEGKTIQFLSSNGEWVDIEEAKFNFEIYRYRIKSEPKYVPYSNKKELLKDSIKHGGYVKYKLDNTFYIIETIYDIVVEVHCKRNVHYIRLFEDYTWADDNSPCGKLAIN